MPLVMVVTRTRTQAPQVCSRQRLLNQLRCQIMSSGPYTLSDMSTSRISQVSAANDMGDRVVDSCSKLQLLNAFRIALDTATPAG